MTYRGKGLFYTELDDSICFMLSQFHCKLSIGLKKLPKIIALGFNCIYFLLYIIALTWIFGGFPLV